MSFTKETATAEAHWDLAKRLKVDDAEIKTISVVDREFPNSALGAPVAGEMSSMMISSGWAITLEAETHQYEYRADKYQLRLHNFHGQNFVINK